MDCQGVSCGEDTNLRSYFISCTRGCDSQDHATIPMMQTWPTGLRLLALAIASVPHRRTDGLTVVRLSPLCQAMLE